MKKKLISFDIFESIEKNSLSTAAEELVEAEDTLAEALEIDYLTLRNFGTETVVYETADQTYINANYSFDGDFVVFENIEELVIDEESERNKNKEVVAKILDAVWENKKIEADQFFQEYMDLPRSLTEEVKIKSTVSTGHGKPSKLRGKRRSRSAVLAGVRSRKRHARQYAGLASKIDQIRGKGNRSLGNNLRTKAKTRIRRTAVRIVESRLDTKLNILCENVLDFVNHKKYGSALHDSQIQLDEKGNVTGVKIPTKAGKMQGKIKKFDWEAGYADNTVHRMKAAKIAEDINFCNAIVDLKRHNAMTDNESLEESIETIISKWPNVIYLTHNELSATIKDILEAVGAKNFSDEQCEFMAEGILRTAHNTYVDRVNKIMKWAGVNQDSTLEDPYAQFKEAVDAFFPTLDMSLSAEMQAYIDIYEALRHIHDIANQEEDEAIKTETAGHLDELYLIITQQIAPQIDIVEAAANWLSELLETNLEGGEWVVSNTPHVTDMLGKSPQMAKNAQVGYTPAKDFSPDWGNPTPVSDGKTYKGSETDKTQNQGWVQVGGNDTYPTLNNPYILKPFGDYEIKGETPIDKDSNQLVFVANKDTYPSLQNPYVPASAQPKMNSDNLVVDK